MALAGFVLKTFLGSIGGSDDDDLQAGNCRTFVVVYSQSCTLVTVIFLQLLFAIYLMIVTGRK